MNKQQGVVDISKQKCLTVQTNINTPKNPNARLYSSNPKLIYIKFLRTPIVATPQRLFLHYQNPHEMPQIQLSDLDPAFPSSAFPLRVLFSLPFCLVSSLKQRAAIVETGYKLKSRIGVVSYETICLIHQLLSYTWHKLTTSCMMTH